MKKRTLVIILSIILAICIGLTIYLFAYPDPIGGQTRGAVYLCKSIPQALPTSASIFTQTTSSPISE
jgi:hypothetical protein